MNAPRTPRSRISGTGHYVPERVMTNADLEKLVDTSDAWILERTGIRERRIAAPGETTSDLASRAAVRAIEAAGLSPKDIDLILIATVTPDRPLPSTAVIVQQKIGARPGCPAMDVAAACSGFLYALSVADAMVANGNARHVLVVGVELLSRIVDFTDRTTCVLFGDGAGAVVVSPADGKSGIHSTHLYADGSLANALYIPAGGSERPATAETVAERQHYVRMVGSDVFKFAVKALASATQEAITSAGITPDAIRWVIAHQANFRIIEGVAKRANIPLERFFVNIERYGNTSSASVPIALDEAVRSGQVRSGDRLVLCALGGGLTWGSALVIW